MEVFLEVTEEHTEVVVHRKRRGHQCPEAWEGREAGLNWDLHGYRYVEG